jgi:hypothetical protein
LLGCSEIPVGQVLIKINQGVLARPCRLVATPLVATEIQTQRIEAISNPPYLELSEGKRAGWVTLKPVAGQ